MKSVFLTSILVLSACSSSISPPSSGPCSGFEADEGVSCTGTFSEGNIVTLSKSGAFGEKLNGERALYVWDFSVGSSTVPESRVAKGSPAYGSRVTDTVVEGSSGAWRHVVTVEYSGDTFGGGLTITPPDMFIFGKMYFSFDGHEAALARQDYWISQDPENHTADQGDAWWNQKGWRLWHEWTHDWLVGYGDDDVDGNPRWGFGIQDRETYPSTIYSGSMKPREWHVQEVEVHQSSGVDVADAWSSFRVNGMGNPNVNRRSRTSAYPEVLDSLYWPQAQRTGWTEADGQFYAYDIVYIDDSLCRAVLTDQAAWNTEEEHRVEITLPLGWSDDVLELKLRRTWSGAYLWAVLCDGTPLRLGRLK